jgi:hypothetical protein
MQHETSWAERARTVLVEATAGTLATNRCDGDHAWAWS